MTHTHTKKAYLTRDAVRLHPFSFGSCVFTEQCASTCVCVCVSTQHERRGERKGGEERLREGGGQEQEKVCEMISFQYNETQLERFIVVKYSANLD